MTFEEIRPRFEALQAQILSPQNLDAWVADWAALSEEFNEAEAWVYINASRDTRNASYQEAFTRFQAELRPAVEKAAQVLNEKLLDSGLRPKGLDSFLRLIRSDREIYREENLALGAELELRSAEQTRIAGAQSVDFEGQTRPLPQMQPFYESADRGLRERAWTAAAQRRQQDVEKLDTLLDALLPLRAQRAKNAGFDSYTDYRFKELGRLDYGVQDALKLHQDILAAFAPLVARKDRWKARQLGLERLRPWDSMVNVLRAEPLKPFQGQEQLYEGVRRIFARLDPEPARMLESLWKKGWLDLESRLGKGPGGFNTRFPKSGGSFIFWNASGVPQDVMVLLHEGGHAYQGHLCESLPLYFQREFPFEFAELASQSMEMLGLAHLDQFYPAQDAERARLQHLLDLPSGLCRVVAIDAFQHRLHAEPGMSRRRRGELFAELDGQSGSQVDYAGWEDYRRMSWQNTLHVFRLPFYYVEYAFAELASLQIWEASLKDPQAAFRRYREGIALGGTRSLPELYRAAGAELLPGRERMQALAAALEDEINAALRRLGKDPL